MKCLIFIGSNFTMVYLPPSDLCSTSWPTNDYFIPFSWSSFRHWEVIPLTHLCFRSRSKSHLQERCMYNTDPSKPGLNNPAPESITAFLIFFFNFNFCFRFGGTRADLLHWYIAWYWGSGYDWCCHPTGERSTQQFFEHGLPPCPL